MSIGHLMMDIEGLTLTAEDLELLAHPAVGGVILFARNFVSPQQIIDLNSAIHEARSSPILIAVDQEGGRVQRFRDGFTLLPPASWYGEQYQRQPAQALRLCELSGWLMAAELRGVGVDFSFAPVLDLGAGPSQVIGNRAFASNPKIVAELTQAWMLGARAAGMASVGKHFPGHGMVCADSHLELPIDERALDAIINADLIPFKQLIDNQLEAVMPAHVLYTQVDNYPAGFSARWLKEILRSKLGFQGVIFSDDLSMGAAQMAGNYAARAKFALDAGCDMVLACNNRAGALEVASALADYRNPVSEQRLLHMRGRPGLNWEELHFSPRWRESVNLLMGLNVQNHT